MYVTPAQTKWPIFCRQHFQANCFVWNDGIPNHCDSNGLQNSIWCGTGIIAETLNDISHWVAPYHMSAKSTYIHGHADLLSEPSLTKSIIYSHFCFTFNIKYFALYLDLWLPNVWATALLYTASCVYHLFVENVLHSALIMLHIAKPTIIISSYLSRKHI